MNVALLQCHGDQPLSKPVLQNACAWAYCHWCESNAPEIHKSLFLGVCWFVANFAVYIAAIFCLFLHVKPEKAISVSVTEKLRYARGAGFYELCTVLEFLSSASVWRRENLGFSDPALQAAKAGGACASCVVGACVSYLRLLEPAKRNNWILNILNVKWMAMLEAAWIE